MVGRGSNTGVILMLERCCHVHRSHLRACEGVNVAAFRARVLGIAVTLGPIEDQ